MRDQLLLEPGQPVGILYVPAPLDVRLSPHRSKAGAWGVKQNPVKKTDRLRPKHQDIFGKIADYRYSLPAGVFARLFEFPCRLVNTEHFTFIFHDEGDVG